jgi:hypothetical protein
MEKIYLKRADLQKIQTILSSFPEVQNFTIEQRGQSGIGCLVDLVFDTMANGVKGKMTVPITDESQW